MIAYKLFRQLKNGDITSLYINKSRRLPYNTWMEAEKYPTKGFALRPFWHCMEKPVAPHLSLKDRVWKRVDIEEFVEFKRPESQGNTWYLAKRLLVFEEDIEVVKVVKEFVDIPQLVLL